MTISEIRSYITELGSDVARIAFAPRLAAIVEEAALSSAGKLAVRLDLDPSAAATIDRDLSADGARELLQIAREALSNAIRHSGARHATVQLERVDGAAVLRIADDGRGFEPGDVPRQGHFGLANLHERAATLGGALEIRSATGAGTRIIATIPLDTGEEPA